MSWAAVVIVGAAFSALLAAAARGFHGMDADGAVVVEPVEWVPKGSHQLRDRQEKVRTETSNDVALLDRRVDLDSFAIVVLGAVVVIALALLGDLRAAGLAAIVLGPVEIIVWRRGSQGMYVTRNGVEIRRLFRSDTFLWAGVDRFALVPGHEGEHVGLVSTDGRVTVPPGFGRSRGYATRRFPVGPMRWRMHAFEQLVDQLNAMAAQSDGQGDLG